MNSSSGSKVVQFKLVLLGDSAVGKSSLVLRFVRGQFFEYQESTIGAAFLTQVRASPQTPPVPRLVSPHAGHRVQPLQGFCRGGGEFRKNPTGRVSPRCTNARAKRGPPQLSTLTPRDLGVRRMSPSTTTPSNSRSGTQQGRSATIRWRPCTIEGRRQLWLSTTSPTR